MFSNLREYLDLLRRYDLLVEIKTEVDPELEAAEIHRRVIAGGGPALLFRNIKGSRFPLATNLFGTQQRVDLAFGPKPEQVIAGVAKLPESMLPPTLKGAWDNRKLFGSLLKVGIKRSGFGPVCEVVESPPRLTTLPLLTTWKLDGGPFVTLPLVYTEDPQTGIPNLGMYRIQRFDDCTTGLHCQIGKGAAYHLDSARKLGKNLPVNIHIGGPPALILSAIAPLPENVPELLLASLAMGRRLELATNPAGPLPVCSQAEFVLVGEVDPHQVRPEGPFGDHYGYYSLQHDYPVFKCHSLLRRKDAICTATVVGKPRQEDFFIGDYLQKLLSPLFPLVMPTVTDLWSYGETGYHSLAAAVVQERFKREAMVSAFRILGEGQLALTKFLLVLDRRCDLTDFKQVLSYVLERCDLRTDLYIFSNLSMDTLDYNGPAVNHGSKGVMLGIGEPVRELPVEFNAKLPAYLGEVAIFCRGCLVISLANKKKLTQELVQKITSEKFFANWPLIVVSDNAKKSATSSAEFLWSTFTRFEPGAHIHARQKSIEHNHITYTGPILIDATTKPGFPDELVCDPDTAKLVDNRWKEYFPG